MCQSISDPASILFSTWRQIINENKCPPVYHELQTKLFRTNIYYYHLQHRQSVITMLKCWQRATHRVVTSLLLRARQHSHVALNPFCNSCVMTGRTKPLLTLQTMSSSRYSCTYERQVYTIMVVIIIVNDAIKLCCIIVGPSYTNIASQIVDYHEPRDWSSFLVCSRHNTLTQYWFRW